MEIIIERINRKNYKKISFLFLGMLLVFFCCSCQRGQQNEGIPETTVSETLMSDIAVISVDGEFYNIIANNPIDKEFISEDVSSEQRIRIAVAYRNQWNAEIEHTLDILQGFLSQEDYQSLVLAYEAWQQYLQNTILVEQNLFYIGSSYKNEKGDIIGCNDTYPQVMEVAANRTRDYAVELMAIEYAFTGNVEFVMNATIPTTENTKASEKIENQTSGMNTAQMLRTEEHLLTEIKNLLSYDIWIDDTQVVLCTKDDIQRSGMAEEFQQILNGDFSEVEGLRNEAERGELKRDYEKREKWEYMLQDMNGDGIEELCIKDGKGRMGIFYAAGNEAYAPELIEIWSFGEIENNLLAEDGKRGTNAFFFE